MAAAQMVIEGAKADIRAFVSQNTDRDDFADDLDLFEGGLVNSLFVLELMSFLQKSFGVTLEMADLDMANFQSVNAMVELVKRKGA